MIRKSLFLIPALGLLGMAAALPAQTARPDGAALFRMRCASCHNMTPGARAVLAPSLIGVVGRKAASTAFNYSPALKASNLTWNRANLDRFLTAPGRMVPGTRMVIGLPDAAQRAAVLDFLGRPPGR
jgi:cytochrome c